MQNLLNRFSQKFGGKMPDEPRKKSLDFDSNPDHITLRYVVCGYRVTDRWGSAILCMGGLC